MLSSGFRVVRRRLGASSVVSLCLSLGLAGCGGGGDAGGSAASGNPAAAALLVDAVQLAQSHVIPAAGRQWQIDGGHGLHLAAQRKTLLLVDIKSPAAHNPYVEVWLDGKYQSRLFLSPPSQLPRTENNEAAYATQLWSAYLPAELMQTGLKLRFAAQNYTSSAEQAIAVGPETEAVVNIVPLYLFGANEVNTDTPFSSVATPSAAIQASLYQSWPFSKLTIRNHSVTRLDFPSLVIAPRSGEPAKRVSAYKDTDGAQIVEAALDLAYQLQLANGESNLNQISYWSAIVIDDRIAGANKKAWLGRGLGSVGGYRSAGDHYYEGLFYHEMGHALGLGHTLAASNASPPQFPYPNGSLKGSTWGFDMDRQAFRSPLIPANHGKFLSCRNDPGYRFYVLHEDGRCYRSDPMDVGSDESGTDYRYGIFSDYSVARIQEKIEGRARPDRASPTGFSRWDKQQASWVAQNVDTEQSGAWGIGKNYPVAMDTPVHTVMLDYSKPGTAGVSGFYPPIAHRGNLIATIDPTDAQQLDRIYAYDRANGSSPDLKWYCHTGGCDYTLRLSYSDGSQAYRVLKGAFRKHSYPETFDTTADDPKKGESLRRWAVNIPAPQGVALRKLELLDTPMVWKSTPAAVRSASVLMAQELNMPSK